MAVLSKYDIEHTLPAARDKISDETFYDIYDEVYQDLLDNMALNVDEWHMLCRQCNDEKQKFGTFEHGKVNLEKNVDKFYEYIKYSCELNEIKPLLTIRKNIAAILENSGDKAIQDQKKILETAVHDIEVLQGQHQEKKGEYDNLDNEVKQKNQLINTKTKELDTLKEECAKNKKKYKENKKLIIQKRIEQANLQYDIATLQAELEFAKEQKEKYDDRMDEPLCSNLTVFLDGYHHNRITTFRLILCSLMIFLGAVTISSTFTCVHPFGNDIESKHLILFWFLPFISASFSCAYFVFAKRFFDNDSYDTMFFLNDRRILISILNFAYIVMSIIYYFYCTKLIACFLIRTLQGIIVGFLSIIYPVSLFQIGKTKQPLYLLSFFLVSFAFGVLFCVPIKQKWPLYVVIFPGLQTILIWFINKSSFNFVNLKVDFGSDFKFHLEFLVIVLHILQPFLGPFTLWTVISRIYSDPLENVKFILPFVVGSFVFCIFLIILRMKNENTFALASILLSIPSLVFALIGVILVITHKDYYGLMIMSFSNGIGLLQLPWLPYYETLSKIRPKTFGFYWCLYWLSTSISSVIFTKMNLYNLSFVWLAFICLIIIFFSVYLTLFKYNTCNTIL
ncbi:hypothetical protein TVAG_347230 [Trichomonas vaginalis G3]|uniref:Uncharacterized protein n=1 Tax=Trichomonas vaginalis (strain ATCC PRA-98 / G3) TaxID=412133 RepID=A2FSG9_TRIV3|nr:hypothetical protein TVAGG3_0714990 [Trichomonas vaginalis G3]EAX92140.1 hypothetical protein TVAG_347230 [Trichomonas vaginalis G3]KAI5510188.1 hypothetical protein TVAGG3_0714990 [Trichomonas vaginalis G3]|eukprot:XP_001305070.1 hypothetical protein [Trichomonas vaginalis G3]